MRVIENKHQRFKNLFFAAAAASTFAVSVLLVLRNKLGEKYRNSAALGEDYTNVVL